MLQVIQLRSIAVVTVCGFGLLQLRELENKGVTLGVQVLKVQSVVGV